MANFQMPLSIFVRALSLTSRELNKAYMNLVQTSHSNHTHVEGTHLSYVTCAVPQFTSVLFTRRNALLQRNKAE